MNVQRLTAYIERTKSERANERLCASREKEEMEQQIRSLRSDNEQLQQALRKAQMDYTKEASAVQQVQEKDASRICHLEGLLNKERRQVTNLQKETATLNAANDTLNRKIILRIRHSRFLGRFMTELQLLLTCSCERRKQVCEAFREVSICLDELNNSLSSVIQRMEQMKANQGKVQEEHIVLLRESESARHDLQIRLDKMRDEYTASIGLVDDCVRKKISKHESALVKMHALYECEKSAKSALESKVIGFTELESELRQSIDRITVEAETRVKQLEYQLQNQRQLCIVEVEASSESLQRQLDIREKDIREMCETLDRMRTSLRVKEEVVMDLSSQVRDLKAQLASLEEEKNSECSAHIDRVKRELEENRRDTAYLKRQLEEAESTIQQKEQIVQYVSSEMDGIKEGYEAKLSSQENANKCEMSKMKQKLADAANALLQLDKVAKESEKENECLRLKLDEALRDKSRLEHLNSQKISQIKCILGDSVS